MWWGAMVYWSWRMAPSWNSLLITNHSVEGACVHHRLLQLATGKLRTTESRYLHYRSDCYRLERQVAGWELHPLKIAAFARRTKGTSSFLGGRPQPGRPRPTPCPGS